MFKVGMTVKGPDGLTGVISAIDSKGFVSVKYKDGSSSRYGPGIAADSLTPTMPTWEKVAIGAGAVGGAGLLVLILRSLFGKK